MAKNTGLSDEFQKIDDKIKRKKWYLLSDLIWDPNLGDLQYLSKTNKELWLNISFS